MATRKAKGPVAREFMTENVITVLQDESVAQAVAKMATHDIGSVVALGQTGPRGVFTERDLLAKVIALDRDPRTTVVKEVLSATSPAIDADMKAEEAAATMIRKKNRLLVVEGGRLGVITPMDNRAVVMDGSRLVGIITPTDVVRVISELNSTFDISKVVSREIVSVSADTPIVAAVKKMGQRRIGSVIVSVGGRPAGIFTERDLLKRTLVPEMRLDRPVSEVMSAPLITADYGAQAKEVARMMAANRIKRIPLYQDNQMVAIVTARDLVEAYSAQA